MFKSPRILENGVVNEAFHVRVESGILECKGESVGQLGKLTPVRTMLFEILSSLSRTEMWRGRGKGQGGISGRY